MSSPQPPSRDEANPYAAPTADLGSDGDEPRARRPAGTYGEALWSALIQQGVVLLLSKWGLDGMPGLSTSVYLAFVPWALMALMIARRRTSPTWWDLALVKYGFWLFLGPIAFVITSLSKH